MQIYLAPMEGVMDDVMRDLLTRRGNFDLCMTEFVRVSDGLLPNRVFRRYCPELALGGKTPNGTPVRIQLLGQDPELLAENAARAISLGSQGIDLNFGCPAKTVNKSRGGAILLQSTAQIERIVASVRAAIPSSSQLSVKIRLGWEDCQLAEDNALAIEGAGANSLIIHGRTKAQGYLPPADWRRIGKIRSHLKIPVIANGDIWSPDDYRQCRDESGCDDIMLGRGALRMPNLAAQIKGANRGVKIPPDDWEAIKIELGYFYRLTMRSRNRAYFANRTKQWLAQLGLHHPKAKEAFNRIRKLTSDQEIVRVLWQHSSDLI
ncbi:tRNA dihydrouridine synthase [Corallincola spongiicola]|uniref:tRNA-dihydrouridine(16) synthase n=1 Tax=Corallincola spongiicola TaxID=2520508 RepID=A0ABY1WSM1_9GAMM|nr:tRNA-dihydrouridine synthase [Corallincola spongiicola]TAA47702.1 tRNA dihydrouridine(16) synthase DusC [Corallincola spongiicola]